jgi:hypothetical protein
MMFDLAQTSYPPLLEALSIKANSGQGECKQKPSSSLLIFVTITAVVFTYSLPKNRGVLYLFFFQKPWSSLHILDPKPWPSLLILVPKTVVFFTYSCSKNCGLLYLQTSSPKTMVFFPYSSSKN